MKGVVAPPWLLQLLDVNGQPLANGRVYVYQAGTTTPATTYRDAALTLEHPHPVVLDAAGRTTIFLASGSYKFEIRNAQDQLEWPPVDNVTTVDRLLSTIGTWLEWIGQGTPPAVAPAGTARAYYDAVLNRLRVSINGGAYHALVAPVVVPLGGHYLVRQLSSTFAPLPDQVLAEVDGALLAGRPASVVVTAFGQGEIRVRDILSGQALSGSVITVSGSQPTVYVANAVVVPAQRAVLRVETRTTGTSLAAWHALLMVT